MDLIVNRQLDRQEELAIYELTLKKQRSKKRSTVSEKNTIAMQRLAEELFQQRKEFNCLNDDDDNDNDDVHEHGKEVGQLSNNNDKHNNQYLCRCHSANLILPTTTSNRIKPIYLNRNDDNNFNKRLNNGNKQTVEEEEEGEELVEEEQNNLVQSEIRRKNAIELQRQSSTTSTIATSSSSTTSSSSSSSSTTSANSTQSSCQLMMTMLHHNTNLHHCPSPASSLQHQVEQEEGEEEEVAHNQQRPQLQLSPLVNNLTYAKIKSTNNFSTTTTTTGGGGVSSNNNNNKMATIELHKLRLDQLNNELERRLHQYEYLVAQEKAILGLHNMNLFTNEGVNNFHRFEIYKQKLQSSQSCGNIQLGQLKKF